MQPQDYLPSPRRVQEFNGVRGRGNISPRITYVIKVGQRVQKGGNGRSEGAYCPL